MTASQCVSTRYGAWVLGDFPRAKIPPFFSWATRVRRGLNEAQLEFRNRLDAFVDAHWLNVPEPQRAAAWRQGLLDAGWSVSFWPVEAGGAGWDATQKYLWSETLARRDVLLPPDPGVEIVGPVLLATAPVPGPDRRGIRVHPSPLVRVS